MSGNQNKTIFNNLTKNMGKGMEKKLKCPRCGKINLKDYGKVIECLDCCLEFDKDDVINFGKNALSIQEKKRIVDELTEGINKKKLIKKIKKKKKRRGRKNE